MKAVEVLLVVGVTLFSCVALVTLFEFYMNIRFACIVKYLNDRPHVNHDQRKIAEACERFWVWPIGRFFE